AAGGLKIVGIVVVLHDDRDSVQRAELSGEFEFAVEPVSLGQSIGIDHNDGIQAGRLIIGLNAHEVGLHQLMTSHFAGADGGLSLSDGGLSDFKLSLRLQKSTGQQSENADEK